VWFAAGGVLDEGYEIKAREDRVGEEMGGEFDVLRRGEVSAKVEIRQIDGPKESIRRDDRVEKQIDAVKRSDVVGGGAGGLKAITPSRAAYAAVNVRGEGAEGSRYREGRREPFVFWDGVEVSGGGGSEVDGTEGASGLDQLHQFGVAGEKPLKTVRAREGRMEGEGRARRVEIEDRGAGGGDGGKGRRGGARTR
jgi:hypothetical protein